MPKLAANITTMFQEHDMLDRFQAAARCGFKAVEILFPYRWSKESLRDRLETTGLELLLINTRPGDEFGLAALTGHEEAFRQSFHEALEYARYLNIRMIHVMAGKVSEGDVNARRTFVSNLRWAADLIEAEGITLNLEPLNDRDVPGYLHARCQETAELIEVIGKTNVRLQFDLYHQQMMGGDLIAKLDEYRGLISHVQFSSVPGRQEPQYGEVDIHRILEHLDETGYLGWVSCEYTPRGNTVEGLTWGLPYGLLTS